LREIAAKAEAPVNASTSCQTNIEIVFTTAPQALLDQVRKSHPVYLGYHYNDTQAEQLAKVTHPIQAWYTTATVDLRGKPLIDVGGAGYCTTVCVPGDLSASSDTVSATRLGDSHRSALYHV
jgi:hypothetical protein